jgi:predicted ATPase
MQPVRITLKNYRCFADSDPAQIELGSGFTAFVGPNNSGKSSLLRFLVETRDMWAVMLSWGNLKSLVNGGEIGRRVDYVEDQTEIFCDANDRPLTLEIEFLTTATLAGPRIARTRLERKRNGHWAGEFYCDQYPNEKCRADGAEILTPSNPPQAVAKTSLLELFELLHGSMYVPPFRNAISENTASYYDMTIGASFISQWHNWATGGNKAHNRAILRVQNDIQRIFGLSDLTISATSDAKALHLVVDGKPYKRREMGAGLSQFIVVMGNVAIRRPSILLIDEPELNLHPSLQVDFLTSLTSYSAEGAVVYATHSMGLARTVADRIYSFRRTPTGAQVRPFEALTGRYAEFAGEMAFSAFRELGYSTILLVEGPSEVKVAQQFLRVLQRDHHVVVLPLGGSSMIRSGAQQELAELRRLSEKVAVLIDSERAAAGAALDPARAAFLADCQALGFRVHATDRRAMENYFTETAVKRVFGPNYQSLAPFQLLRDLPLAWRKQDNWRVARAIDWPEIATTDLGIFFEALAAAA